MTARRTSKSRIDTSPYGERNSPSGSANANHLSPPDPSWRRAHSDSSLHQSVGQGPNFIPYRIISLFKLLFVLYIWATTTSISQNISENAVWRVIIDQVGTSPGGAINPVSAMVPSGVNISPLQCISPHMIRRSK